LSKLDLLQISYTDEDIEGKQDAEEDKKETLGVGLHVNMESKAWADTPGNAGSLETGYRTSPEVGYRPHSRKYDD
jgi:hypothetical protein